MKELTINRVSNGFVLRDGPLQEYRVADGGNMQVAATPDELADLVRSWAADCEGVDGSVKGDNDAVS